MPMKNPPDPGRSIRTACLEPLGLSVTAGAEVLGVTRQTLNNVTPAESRYCNARPASGDDDARQDSTPAQGRRNGAGSHWEPPGRTNVLGEQEWRGNSCVLPNILSRCRSGFFRTWKLKTEILGKTGD